MRKTVQKALSPKALFKATAYAVAGVRSALSDSSFLRLVLTGFAVGIFLGFVLWPMSLIEVAIVIIAFVLPLLTEIINTAIEATLDLASPEWHQLAKKAKDRAAGATFIALCTAGLLIGVVIGYHFW